MKFEDKIRLLMKENSITQKSLAELTNEHTTAISNYLSGNRKPKSDFIMKLPEVFKDADLNWLFRDENRNELKEDGEFYTTPRTPEIIIENIEENLGELKKLLSQK